MTFLKVAVLAPFWVVFSLAFLSQAFGGVFSNASHNKHKQLFILVEGKKQKQQPERKSRRQLEQFVELILSNTNLFWQKQFASLNREYRRPNIEFYQGKVNSTCGSWALEKGPFYCHLDETIYIDVSFFEILETKFGAPGTFAEAYVVAHEVGHHVQNLLDIIYGPSKFNRSRWVMIRSRKLGLRLELQADCFAGFWARYGVKTTSWLKEEHFHEGLRAAAQVGDDFVFKNKPKNMDSEMFQHGTSKQRSSWFERGYRSDKMKVCDSFAVDEL